MERRPVYDINEMIKLWKNNVQFEPDDFDEDGNPINVHAYEYEFKNLEINFKLDLPFSSAHMNKMEEFLSQNTGTVTFNNCKFLHEMYIGGSERSLIFKENCRFQKRLRIYSYRFKQDLTFSKSVFNDIDCEGSEFGENQRAKENKGKVRFHECVFYYTNFHNTTFNNLVDFWGSIFYNDINFYRTDFKGTTVFSAVTFKRNVLYSYSLFSDVIIFRGTKFKKGLDLSLAIIKGKLSVFDIPVRWWWWQFRSKKGILTEKEYDVCIKGDTIPVKNKRETYRILKKHYEDVNNISDSVSLAVMEKKTLFTEILFNLFSSNKNQTPWVWFIWGKLLDIFNLIILSLNGLSNWFKSSYITGILFTGLVGALFFNLSISYTSNSEFAFNLDSEVIKNGFKYFLSFLNPTHSFDYLGENIPKASTTENGFYLFDYLGRIFVGYGIYQTIQAFRKFR